MEGQSNLRYETSKIAGLRHERPLSGPKGMSETMKIYQKVLLLLVVCAMCLCAALIFLHPLREAVIKAVERFVVHKQLNHLHWHKYLVIRMLWGMVFFALALVFIINAPSVMRNAISKIRYIFRLLLRHKRHYLPYTLSFLALSMAVIRAGVSPILNDEAYTYMSRHCT